MRPLTICLLLVCLPASARAGTVLVEAESFMHLGGWVVDQQSMDAMGSPYLLAHGLDLFGPQETRAALAAPGEAQLVVRSVLLRLLGVFAAAAGFATYVVLLSQAAGMHGPQCG